jgi:hypothetical protein
MVMSGDMNLPPEERPVYEYGSQTYTGEAEGGPRNEEILSYNTLTQFVLKPYKSPPRHFYMDVESQAKLDKEWQQEQERNRRHPDRYDYNLDSKKWIWVEYGDDPED